MSKPEDSLLDFLGERGIEAYLTKEQSYLYPNATKDWIDEVVEALQDNPDLMKEWLKLNHGKMLWDFLDRFQAHPTIASTISRAYEGIATELLEVQSAFFNDYVQELAKICKSISFQLDTQAATVLGQVMRKYSYYTILAQRNLPTEFADEALYEYPRALDVPLSAWRFSRQALEDAVKSFTPKVGEDFPRILANPYLSDERFQFLARNLASNGVNTYSILESMELSEKRWTYLIDTALRNPDAFKAVITCLTRNPNLPYEQALRLLGEDHWIFAPNNVEVIFSKESYLRNFKFDFESFIRVVNTVETPEQVERLYRITHNPKVIKSEKCSPALIEEILVEHALEIKSLAGTMAFYYDEPNVISIRRNYFYYGDFTSKRKQWFENQLNLLLKANDMADATDSPISWKMELVELLLESKIKTWSGANA